MPDSVERKVRAGLPIVQFLQSYVPLPASRWLLKQSMAHVRLDADMTREAIFADGVPCGMT
jgi:hypothetical protein